MTSDDKINKRVDAYIALLLKKEGSAIYIRSTKDHRNDNRIIANRINQMLKLMAIDFVRLSLYKFKINKVNYVR